jgi:hypothetical protein
MTNEPTEAQITAVMEKYTPRQIAIAYLRASKRAKGAEAAFNIMDGIAGATMGLARGDANYMKKELGRSLRAARSHREALE